MGSVEGVAVKRLIILGVSVCLVLLGAPPARAETVTVAVAGDIALPGSPGVAQTQTANLIGAFNPTAVFPLGDEQYEDGALSDFQSSYDPTWGQYLDRSYPVPGNHEYQTPGAIGYYTYFGTRAGDPTKGYYSFDLGDWHIVAVNTECKKIDCAAERTWLKADLDADTHTCDALLWHRTGTKFPTTIGSSKHVDLGLAGHKHVYERYAPVGSFHRFTVGTGGKSIGKLSGTQVFGARAFGILRLTLSDTGYTYEFQDVTGAILDSGSGTCTA
jgi:hypothetical protein